MERARSVTNFEVFCKGIDRTLPVVYLVVALPLILKWATMVPPMQAPDEPAHLYRAAQIAFGEIRTQSENKIVGGHLDVGVAEFVDFFCHAGVGDALGTCRDGDRERARDTRELRKMLDIQWGKGSVFLAYPTTIRYAPFFYLPQVAGLKLGQALDRNIYTSFQLARLCNGLCSAGLVALALHMCRRGKLFLFSVALLPMAVFQSASVSQDSLLIASGLVMGSVLTRRQASERYHFYLFCAALTFTATARAPLIGLAPLMLLPTWRERGRVSLKEQIFAACCALLLAFVWNVYALSFDAAITEGRASSLSPRLAHALQTPSAFPVATFNTFWFCWDSLYKSFVGVLGWSDEPLPSRSYYTAALLLLTSAIACCTTVPTAPARERVTGIISCITSTMLLLVATYLTWSPVGADVVDGMQGRYFLSIVPILAFSLPSAGAWLSAAGAAVRTAAAVIALLCIPQLERSAEGVLVKRYAYFAKAVKAVEHGSPPF